MSSELRKYRNPDTGRYEWFGNMARECECGHELGIHIAGGHDCGSKGCDCEAFKPIKMPRTLPEKDKADGQ